MDAEAKKKMNDNMLVQGSILAIASIIVRVIGLIYRIPLTRIIGDVAMGYYSTAFEFYNLALLLSSYSLPLAVSKLVSARQAEGRYKDAGKVFTVGLSFGFVVGTLASLAVYFCADVYAKFNHSPLVAIPLRVLAPTIFVFSVMGVVRGFFQGYNNMVPTAVSQVVEQIVNAAVSVGMATYMMKKYAGTPEQSAYGAAGGTWGTFLGACAAAVFLLFVLIYKARSFRANNHQTDTDSIMESRESFGMILKVLLLTVLPVVISQTVYQLSGTIDVSIFHRNLAGKGIDELTRNTWWGIYSAKYKLLTNVPVAVASAMGTAIVPSLVFALKKGNMDKVRDKVSSAIKFNMIVAFPCAFGFMSLGRPIMELLYNDSSELTENMMTIGGIAVVFFALSTVSNGILQGINHMFIPVLHSLIALGIHCVTLVLLLRFTEINAMALVFCNVLFAVIVSILNAISIRKYLSYKQEYRTTFLIPLISAVLMGLFCTQCYFALHWLMNLFMKSHPAVNNAISVLVSILLGAFVYFANLIVLGGVSRKEIEDMPKGKLLAEVLTKLHLLKRNME